MRHNPPQQHPSLPLFPERSLHHVLRNFRGGPYRQRLGVLHSAFLPEDANSDELFHHEPGRRRHSHYHFVRSVHIRVPLETILALRQLPLSGCNILAGLVRVRQRLHSGGHKHRQIHDHPVAFEAENFQEIGYLHHCFSVGDCWDYGFADWCVRYFTPTSR